MLLPISLGQVADLEDICDHLPYDPKWEFPRERLKLGEYTLNSNSILLVLPFNDRFIKT